MNFINLLIFLAIGFFAGLLAGLILKGSGLGLALARDLARSLGGELELVVPARQLDPQLPSTGNAFVISLPLVSSG